MVINREAMKLIKENFPLNLDEIIMHDWWIYLCISTFGYVILMANQQFFTVSINLMFLEGRPVELLESGVRGL